MNEIVIRLTDISKKYNLYNTKVDRLKESLHPFGKVFHKDFFALKNIDIEIQKGEIIGIIGRNGSGKSTLLKIISGVLTPTSGKVFTKGNIVPLLELGSGFNPEFTGLENIYFYSSLLGFSRKQMEDKIDQILDFAEVGDFIYQPLKTYSSGMKARLAFAVSININPDILILDEVLSVGDELFRRKSYAKMEEFFKAGKTILFVSHSVQAINHLCTRTIMLDNGENLINGPTKLVTALYQKFLFSNSENKAAIKTEIINVQSNEFLKKELYAEIENKKHEINQSNKNSDIAKQQNIKSGELLNLNYLPDLKPKSTVEYKNYDINVYDINMISLDGAPVNVLTMNDSYYLTYKVKFNLDVSNVSFAMAIMHKQGLTIANAGGIDQKILKTVEAAQGDVYDIKWKFKNTLIPNTYYANVQISGNIKGKQCILYNISDAIVFKIENEQVLPIGGIVNLNQSITINKII
ncbi:MAG: ABC transporter ATP-binding protein [Bacteroidetes bacterium HGW-Bacteroidetes-17]|nr:MAG: ABC transporter ATP-binding protein [Bacteroidetes bacterium HGW-Bacteroidetes-17]